MSGDAGPKGSGDDRRVAMLGLLALAVATVVGTLMLRGQHGLDPWTTSLVLALGTAAVAGRHLLPLRNPRVGLDDEVDRDTGVGNARAVLSLLDRELERAASYGSVFSVAVVEVDHAVFADVNPRRVERTLADLFSGVLRDVRLDDRVCRVPAADRELVVVLLPDTGAEGSRRFTDRLRRRTHDHLVDRGLATTNHVRGTTMTLPGQDERMARFQRRMQVLVGTEDLIGDVGIGARGPRSVADARPDHLGVPGAVGTPQG